jgi:hypothetical protein
MVRLTFVAGTLEIHGLAEGDVSLPTFCKWDPRTRCHRAAAISYADLLRVLVREKIPYEDEARKYVELPAGCGRTRSRPSRRG